MNTKNSTQPLVVDAELSDLLIQLTNLEKRLCLYVEKIRNRECYNSAKIALQSAKDDGCFKTIRTVISMMIADKVTSDSQA